MKPTKLNLLTSGLATVLFVAAPCHAELLFSDHFNTTNTGVNSDLGTRQAGTLSTSTYAGTATIASNQLSVGADKSVFNNVDFEAALTTSAVDFSLSFDAAKSGTSNAALFLSTHTGGTDDRGDSQFGMHLNQDTSNRVILYGSDGNTAITPTTIKAALGITDWDTSDLHTYALVATATTATTGAYDLFIDGIEVFSDKPYALGTGGSNGEINVEIRTFPDTTATYDNLVIEVVPEPGSLALLGLGGLCLLRRRR